VQNSISDTLPVCHLFSSPLLTMRGMPQVYSGDEIGMTGGDDPENRHDFPGGFPGSKRDAFTASGRTPEQDKMHEWVAGLLHFRNGHSVFGDVDSGISCRMLRPSSTCVRAICAQDAGRAIQIVCW
jgi:hypothetical protein